TELLVSASFEFAEQQIKVRASADAIHFITIITVIALEYCGIAVRSAGKQSVELRKEGRVKRATPLTPFPYLQNPIPSITISERRLGAKSVIIQHNSFTQ